MLVDLVVGRKSAAPLSHDLSGRGVGRKEGGQCLQVLAKMASPPRLMGRLARPVAVIVVAGCGCWAGGES